LSDTHPAILLVADISGFTRFVRMYETSNLHAREIIVRLLRALVRASRPPLQVAELEGDAVFFYALARDGDIARVSAAVKAQIPRLFRAFQNEIESLMRVPLCICDACVSVDGLRLKQVAHSGVVAIERIQKFEKLFGLDVIVVHRLLKNTVQSHQYLLLTEPAWRQFDPFYDQTPERRSESLEGVGDVETVVFYEEQVAAAVGRIDDSLAPDGRVRVALWKLGMMLRGVREMVRRKLRGSRPAAS
jgi:hypothetical protein